MRAIAASALVALALAGCSADEATPVSASTDAVCSGGGEHVAVITRLGFGREGPIGVAPGFDLDGRLSDEHDDATCHQRDLIDPDGRVGIDDQLAILLPDIEKVYGNAVDGLVQGAVDNGELLLALRMSGVDDLQNDDCVSLGVEVVHGVPLIGTDGVMEAFQTFDPDPAGPHDAFGATRIQGGLLTAGAGDITIPIKIFDVDFLLHIRGARARFAIDEAGHFDGVLAGGIEYEELIAGVRQGAGVEKQVPLLRAVLSGAADLDGDGDGHCELVSATIVIKAAPAFIRSVPAMATSDAGASAEAAPSE
jgi:hypothetical protein